MQPSDALPSRLRTLASKLDHASARAAAALAAQQQQQAAAAAGGVGGSGGSSAVESGMSYRSGSGGAAGIHRLTGDFRRSNLGSGGGGMGMGDVAASAELREAISARYVQASMRRSQRTHQGATAPFLERAALSGLFLL